MSPRSCWPVLAIALLSSATATAVHAQRYNHWRSIDRVEREFGGIARVSAATPEQLRTFTDQLLERAQFYQDLADFQAVVARDHARFRDSIARAGGPAVPAATYYRGRASHELGLKADAGQAYRAVASSAPAGIRSAAAAWNATLAQGGGRSWQQDLVDWRAGLAKSVSTCAPDAAPCALLKAIVDDDLQAMYRLQRGLAEKGQPADFRIAVREGNEPSFNIQFFDPLVLSMLAATDYALVANLLKGKTGQDVKRGVALLRIGRVTEAAPLLRNGGGPYLAEALFRSGSRAEAESMWKPLSGGVANLAWDIKGMLAPDAQGMLARYRADSATGLARMRSPSAGGTSLARALLRHQLPDQALTVLESVVPDGATTDLNMVQPDALVLLSRARYEVGSRLRQRDLFPLARGPIASMARDLPILQSTLELLQQVTMPPNIADVRTR